MEIQDSNLRKRVVHLIKNHISPKEIYDLMNQREVHYLPADQEAKTCEDRAVMSSCMTTAGRITEITGGPVFKWDNELKKTVRVPGKKHPGLQREDLHISADRILVTNMEVVKRSARMIEEYGLQIATRDDFAIPLKLGLYDNVFWDQLVPFGWLILEFLQDFAPEKGKLFRYEDTQAYIVIKEITDNFPNWFRSQAEHFFGHFLLTDTVKLSKFVKIQDPKHVKHYIGYDWTEQLKDKSVSMDFDWIQPAIETIQERIKARKVAKEWQ